MLPKNIRDIRKDAKKSLSAMRSILKTMDDSLGGTNERHILLASAFFQIIKYHLEEGDLTPENVALAALLRDGEIQ